MSGERVGPAGLAVRDAVRRALADLVEPSASPSGPELGSDDAHGDRAVVLVACSGGPDSLALAAGTAFVAPRAGLPAGAVVVDHGLQPGSERIAAAAAATCRALGLSPVDVVRVAPRSGPGEGPEAAARTARYAALDAAAATHDARTVLLGHTREDQAETVLLGLLRGSGARSLSGMPARRGVYRRPLLDLPRATTVAACAELGLEPWADPHNQDPVYARARARVLLTELEERLGGGSVAGLARTADLLRADDEALETWAEREYAASRRSGPQPAADQAGNGHDPAREDPVVLDCAHLARLPQAVRNRVIRRAALAAGARSADLTSTHLTAIGALLSSWHGQGPVALPGPATAVRDCGRLLFASQPDLHTRTSTEE